MNFYFTFMLMFLLFAILVAGCFLISKLIWRGFELLFELIRERYKKPKKGGVSDK